MNKWKALTDKDTVEKVIVALSKRNIEGFLIQTGKEAKEKALSLIPSGSRVLSGSSVTLETIGLKDALDNSDKFVSVRKEYMALNQEKDADLIRKLRSTPDVMLGSVHAVTQKGEIIIASNTGSQLGAYVYGAPKVIWIVGTQKIVKDIDEGIKRLKEYVVPLEEKHMQSLYGIGTNLSKLLEINMEKTPNRIKLIFVNEILGF